MGNRIVDMLPGDKKTIHKCSKHPTVEAKETCVRCGTNLCADCRIKDTKQAFCSTSCYRLHRLKEFKFSSLNPLPHLRRLQEHTPALDAFAMMVILMLIAAIHFIPSHEVKKDITLETKQADIAEETDIEKIISIKKAGPAKKPGAATPNKTLVSTVSKKVTVKPTIPKQPPAEPKAKKKSISRSIKASSISKVKAAGKKLSITFDGGSNGSSAREILDVLKSRGINTTFFLTASFIRSYPDIVKRMVAEGHEVGNHTFTHPHLTTYATNRRHNTLPRIDFTFIKNELESTQKLFTKLTGQQMAPYWRAPYGEINSNILRWAAEAGYQHISWTVDRHARESMDSLDWVADQNSSLYLSSEEIKERLLAFADSRERARGGIVLMHLGTERKVDQVHEKLEDIIDSFLAKGYEMVSVSTLLKSVKKS